MQQVRFLFSFLCLLFTILDGSVVSMESPEQVKERGRESATGPRKIESVLLRLPWPEDSAMGPGVSFCRCDEIFGSRSKLECFGQPWPRYRLVCRASAPREKKLDPSFRASDEQRGQVLFCLRQDAQGRNTGERRHASSLCSSFVVSRSPLRDVQFSVNYSGRHLESFTRDLPVKRIDFNCFTKKFNLYFVAYFRITL